MKGTNDLLQTGEMLSATTELTEDSPRHVATAMQVDRRQKEQNTISNNMLRTSASFQLLGQIRDRKVSLFLAYFKALRLWRTGDGPATQAAGRNKINNSRDTGTVQ